jgi:hypothetical protein
MYLHSLTYFTTVRERKYRYVLTLSYFCKLFGTPKMCIFPWCTLNMVQWLAWWWLCESKNVATFIIDNKLVAFWLKYIQNNEEIHNTRHSFFQDQTMIFQKTWKSKLQVLLLFTSLNSNKQRSLSNFLRVSKDMAHLSLIRNDSFALEGPK